MVRVVRYGVRSSWSLIVFVKVLVHSLIGPILASFSSFFGSCYAHAHEHIVNIIKLYIEGKNKHVELIRFRKNSYFIDMENFEVRIYIYNSILTWQHAILKSGARTPRTVTKFAVKIAIAHTQTI